MTEATSPATVPQWTLGDRLRKAREFAGLQQTELPKAPKFVKPLIVGTAFA